jgi:hypothetical protein
VRVGTDDCRLHAGNECHAAPHRHRHRHRQRWRGASIIIFIIIIIIISSSSLRDEPPVPQLVCAAGQSTHQRHGTTESGPPSSTAGRCVLERRRDGVWRRWWALQASQARRARGHGSGGGASAARRRAAVDGVDLAGPPEAEQGDPGEDGLPGIHHPKNPHRSGLHRCAVTRTRSDRPAQGAAQGARQSSCCVRVRAWVG